MPGGKQHFNNLPLPLEEDEVWEQLDTQVKQLKMIQHSVSFNKGIISKYRENVRTGKYRQ